MKKYKFLIYLLLLFSVLFVFSCKNTQGLNIDEDIKYEKIDKNKEIVFLSKELEKIKIKDYKSFDGYNQTGIVINIPNINIKSKDISYFNSQMNKFAKYKIDEYNKYAKEKFTWKFNVDYKFYQKNDILSVIVFGYEYEYERKINYSKLDDYRMVAFSSINIDLKTGNKISDKEMLKRFNIDKFDERVITYIESLFPIESLNLNSKEDKEMLNMYKLSISRSLGLFWDAMYFSKSNQYNEDRTYWVDFDEINNKPSLFYDSDSDKLLVNLKLISHNEKRRKFLFRKGDFFFKTFDISNYKPKVIKLNKTYEYYAKKKGINPNSKNAPLMFSGYLGYYGLGDEALKNFQGVISNAKIDLKKLSYIETVHNGQDGYNHKGDELYILIPKYDYLSLQYDIMGFDIENPERLLNYGVDGIGDTFLRANVSELFNDCVITMTYKDKKVQYEPNQSLVDGSNSVVEGVVDITDIINKESLKNTQNASKFFKELLKD